MEEEREDAGAPAKSGKKLPLIPLLIVVVGVVVIGAGAYFFLTMGKKPESKVEGRGNVSSTEPTPGTVEKISPNPLYYFDSEFKVNTKDGAFASAKIVLELEDYYFMSEEKPAAQKKEGGEGEGETKPAGEGGEAGGEEGAQTGLLAQQINENLPKLRDYVINEFNAMTSAELTSPEGKAKFKKDVIDYINKEFAGTAGRVIDLYFEELIVA